MICAKIADADSVAATCKSAGRLTNMIITMATVMPIITNMAIPTTMRRPPSPSS